MEETAAATFCATLVDELARLGVTDAVIAPGSRSTPMALALDAEHRVRVQVHPDERSAAFLALGLGRASGRPALVLTTSGTAAVELHPAVVEASYDRVPLIALTADRPPELQGVGAPQTIDQRQLFGSSVRAFVDAGVPDAAEAGSWRALARSVVSAALGSPPGPVQLNLPFRDPLVGAPGALPPGAGGSGESSAPRRPEPELTDDDLDALVGELGGRRGVIVAGGHVDRPDAVLALADVLRWPVVADPRSGCRVPHASTVAHGDALLRVERWLDAPPDVVLRLGTLPASKVLGQWLSTGGAARQVGVDVDGVRSDPDRTLDRLVTAAPGRGCQQLVARLDASDDDEWRERWQVADRRAAVAIAEVLDGQAELADPAVARTVVAAAPDGSTLVVSSSMPVRDVEWYAAPRTGVRVLSNRGANGIDGVVSTAVGVALAAGPTVGLLGDLAFLHDVNGLLGAADRGVDLALVVVDNDGGAIFSFLPQASALDRPCYERLFGTPHGLDLVDVARAHGVPAEAVTTADELATALAAPTDGVRVLVARTDRHANVAVHEALHTAVAQAITRPQ